MSKLALLGGPQTITEDFPRYNPIGKEEVEAAKAVVETGILSPFLGSWVPNFRGANFYGGQKVQELERAWEKHFNAKYAVTVNSNTSGLIAAVGAVRIEPGDEVIVSPWTMSASATCILTWNAIPVFADIEQETFNLDPTSIKKNITPYTRAIVVSDIFGHAAQLDEIMAIAKENDLKVIEDCAQAPGALYKDRFVGTIVDIGVFSLNYHKHIHTGEGGVCVTDNPALAERIQLIRNHAEAVVEAKGVTDLSNMLGFNFRMTEIQAAIGIEQLKKLEYLVSQRVAAVDRLIKGIKDLNGLQTPVVKPGCTHVYYVCPLLIDESKTDVSRDLIIKAMQAEGVSLSQGYINLHLLPMYQRKIAYGKNGFPWSANFYKGQVSYKKGICPVAEELQDKQYAGLGMCLYKYTSNEIDLIIRAFLKVWDNLEELKSHRS